MLLTFLKLTLAPALVVLATLAGRRWGPAVGGFLVTLPVVAGPILLITRLEQGPQFATRAAEASLLGLVALAAFVVAVSHLGRLVPWWAALPLAWSVCLGVGALLVGVSVGALAGLVLSAGAAVVAGRLLPATTGAGALPRPAPRWELAARAGVTALLVVAVTEAAGALGPARTGVLTPFPIAASVMAAFALAYGGPAGLVRTMHGVLRGLPAFGAFCAACAVLLPRWDVAPAFLGALLTGAAAHAVLLAVPHARARAAGAGQPRLMSATTAPVSATRSAGASPTSSPRRPPET